MSRPEPSNDRDNSPSGVVSVLSVFQNGNELPWRKRRENAHAEKVAVQTPEYAFPGVLLSTHGAHAHVFGRLLLWSY